jgi:hypothetical protein
MPSFSSPPRSFQITRRIVPTARPDNAEYYWPISNTDANLCYSFRRLIALFITALSVFVRQGNS